MLNLVENILFFYLGGVSGNTVITGKSVGCITGNNGIFFILIEYVYLTEYRIPLIDAVNAFQRICFPYNKALVGVIFYNSISFFKSASIHVIIVSFISRIII